MGNCLWRQAGPRSTVKCSLMRITVARLSFRYALGSRVTDPIRYTPVPILPTVLLRSRSWICGFSAAKHVCRFLILPIESKSRPESAHEPRYSPLRAPGTARSSTSTRLIDRWIGICGIEITFRRVAAFAGRGKGRGGDKRDPRINVWTDVGRCTLSIGLEARSC